MQRKNLDFDLADQEKLNKVFVYKEKRKFSKGLTLLHELEKRNNMNPIIFGLIATFYYETKDYTKSAKYFKKTTILNPNSEVASLGLFHSLIELKRPTSAIKELVRFTSFHKYRLYKTTISELKDNLKAFNRKNIKLINDL